MGEGRYSDESDSTSLFQLLNAWSVADTNAGPERLRPFLTERLGHGLFIDPLLMVILADITILSILADNNS